MGEKHGEYHCPENRAAKGIFWIVEREELQKNEPYLFRILVGGDGVARRTEPPLNSKRGDNYTHEKTCLLGLHLSRLCHFRRDGGGVVFCG